MSKQFISVISLALVIAGCSANSVAPEAKVVRMTNSEPGKECKFLGDATGTQGNFLTGKYTSNANLEIGAQNDLKNKAAAMGGNVVAIISQRSGQTGNSGSTSQTNVVVTGNVYACPE